MKFLPELESMADLLHNYPALLQAILNLLIILIPLWSHERQGIL